MKAALKSKINLGYRRDGTIHVALDETTDAADIAAIVLAFAAASGGAAVAKPDRCSRTRRSSISTYPKALARTSPFLTHPVFNTHHSETQMMRYIRSLERKDIGLDTSMIPLGSCTMKLNAASEMLPITWPEFGKLHPFVPVEQAEGYQQIFRELEAMLCEITGFAAVSLQPNSGAQGEFAGLMVIRAYHRDRGETHRDVVLIPASAHGTNPASAAMVGMHVVVVASTRDGNIDVDDLTAKAEAHKDRLAALMVTYPSTHGVFEESIQDICAIVHEHGGQVYMDGANMNAQVGLTSPAVDRRRRLPHQPAQDVQHPARRRRPGHGADRRRGAPRAVPARASDREDRRRARDSRAVGGAVGQRQHPADLVRLHEDARARRHDRRDALRDPQRELPQVAARAVLPGALHAQERPRRARDDLRPAAAEAGERRSTSSTSPSG